MSLRDFESLDYETLVTLRAYAASTKSMPDKYYRLLTKLTKLSKGIPYLDKLIINHTAPLKGVTLKGVQDYYKVSEGEALLLAWMHNETKYSLGFVCSTILIPDEFTSITSDDLSVFNKPEITWKCEDETVSAKVYMQDERPLLESDLERLDFSKWGVEPETTALEHVHEVVYRPKGKRVPIISLGESNYGYRPSSTTKFVELPSDCGGVLWYNFHTRLYIARKLEKTCTLTNFCTESEYAMSGKTLVQTDAVIVRTLFHDYYIPYEILLYGIVELGVFSAPPFTCFAAEKDGAYSYDMRTRELQRLPKYSYGINNLTTPDDVNVKLTTVHLNKFCEYVNQYSPKIKPNDNWKSLLCLNDPNLVDTALFPYVFRQRNLGQLELSRKWAETDRYLWVSLDVSTTPDRHFKPVMFERSLNKSGYKWDLNSMRSFLSSNGVYKKDSGWIRFECDRVPCPTTSWAFGCNINKIKVVDFHFSFIHVMPEYYSNVGLRSHKKVMKALKIVNENPYSYRSCRCMFCG